MDTDGRRSGGGRGRRGLRWTALGLAAVLVGAAGAGFLYYEHLNDNIQQAALDLGDHKAAALAPNAAGQTPLNPDPPADVSAFRFLAEA